MEKKKKLRKFLFLMQNFVLLTQLKYKNYLLF